MTKYLMFLFPIIGVFSLVKGILEFIKIKSCEKCIAMIIDFDYQTTSDSDGDYTTQFPIYEVERKDGTKQVIRSKMGSNKKLGECVNVFMSEDGKIYEISSAIFTTALGIIFLVVGIVVLSKMGIF